MSLPVPSHKHIDANHLADATKKRRKGATRLSCAECRRLKLRCDRSIPCGSCIKRGCRAICPDGSLTTGQGNRFVLASTQELHEKIGDLCTRVRSLEDALRYSHSLISTESHPLLAEELLHIKAPLQREPPEQRGVTGGVVKEEESNPDVIDAFGSLSISVTGRTKYFGSIANSWYFLQNETAEEDGIDVNSSRLSALQNVLPPEILARSGAFPILPLANSPVEVESDRLRVLFWYLPPANKADELSQIYFRYAGWMYNPLSQENFYEQIYSQFYDPNVGPPSDDPLLSHRLSVLFMILAIGSLMDLSQPAYNIEAEKYHQLARAALFQSTLFEEPTVNAVQALFLMTFYLFLSDRHGSKSGTRWAMMGMAIKIAQSIGLHRDSGRWKVEPQETHRRRELFWELFTYDSWQCLTFGRPPSFVLAHVDCKMPYSNDAPDELTYHAWKHRFASECMSAMHDQAFGAKSPTYATVLQLDRKLRAFPVPPILQVAGFGSSEPRAGGFPESVMLTLQRHIVLAIREMNLLYLHRSFFARAVSDHPKDPLGSPYGSSVIAAYRSAGSLIALMRNLHTQLKEPSERIWFLWTHMFSCAIVLGSIVTRCPSMSLAPSALVQLDSACELFSKAANGFGAQKVLEIMIRLQEKAHISLSDHRAGIPSPVTRQLSAGSEPISPQDDDELSTLGGKTRLVAKKEYQTPSPVIVDRSPTSLNPVVPLPLHSGSGHLVHPSVVDYLRTFGSVPAEDPTAGAYSESFAESSSYSSMSLPQNSPHPTMQYTEPQSYHPDTQMEPTGLVAGSYPTYFPVYDYGSSGQNSYAHMFGQRRESPEANNMNATWQDFVNELDMGS